MLCPHCPPPPIPFTIKCWVPPPLSFSTTVSPPPLLGGPFASWACESWGSTFMARELGFGWASAAGWWCCLFLVLATDGFVSGVEEIQGTCSTVILERRRVRVVVCVLKLGKKGHVFELCHNILTCHNSTYLSMSIFVQDGVIKLITSFTCS
ncbi:hypothetical protein Droror1_Dr00009129 [Drosera rotundifolia]